MNFISLYIGKFINNKYVKGEGFIVDEESTRKYDDDKQKNFLGGEDCTNNHENSSFYCSNERD